MDRNPDIEIYIKNTDAQAITAWLDSLAGQLDKGEQQPNIQHYVWHYEGEAIPVMLHERVVGKAWTSLWFNSSATPWAVDLDCAKAAATALATQVRCTANGWTEGDEPDTWWKVETDSCEEIQWRT